jgi:GT2 family glycosyltransferase
MRVNTNTLPVSVVVLTWNGRRWLDRCLTSILQLDPAPHEVVLVDNASTDDSVSYVREAFPSVRVLQLQRNLGYSGGNNAGARAASGQYLAFVNNDTELDSRWLGELFKAIERDEGIGLATSRVVFMEAPDTIDSAGDGYLRCGGAYKRRHGARVDRELGNEEVFGACGAGFVVRRELFTALGGFDEDFFMVYEDVDLSYRARLAGARCVYVPSAVVRHAGSGSIGATSPAQVFYGQRNLEWTWIKNSPGPLLWRSLLSHVAYDLAGAAGYARQGRLGTWCRAKAASVAGLGRMLRKRRDVQRARRIDSQNLWRLMDPGWVNIKRREKAFDFRRLSSEF